MTALVPVGAKHPIVVHLRRLSGRRSARSEAGEVLVEGLRAVRELLDDGLLGDGVRLRSLLVADRSAAEPAVVELVARAVAAGVPAFGAADRVVDSVASTVTPQPVVAAVSWSPGTVPPAAAQTALVLAGVADPGNAGALLRVAEAAGIDVVVFADDAVDPGNPKVVRSAAGSLFRVPVVVAGSSAEVIAGLAADGWRCIGLDGGGDVAYDEVPVDGRVAVVVGSEAHGIPAPTAAGLDLRAAIPMAGRVESLNAAVAAGVVCFDLARRRRPHAAG